MNQIQQQRMIGAVLLLCLVVAIALFLLSSVSENTPQTSSDEPFGFDSIVETIDEDIAVVEPVEEALVDPHGIASEQEMAAAEEPTVPDASPEVAATTVSPAAEDVSSQPAAGESQTDTAAAPAPATAPSTPVQDTAVDASEPLLVLQVMSLSTREKADALVKQLGELGYDAMIEPATSNGKTIYRVRLKPSTDRALLERSAKDIESKLNLPSLIMHYDR